MSQFDRSDAPRILLGTHNKQGQLHVEYRSKAGKLGLYLLLRNAEFTDRETGEIRQRCLLGFVDGRKTSDGKDGFWVDRDKVIFGDEEQAPRPFEEKREEPPRNDRPLKQDHFNLPF